MSANPYDPAGVMFGAAQTNYYVEPELGSDGEQTFIGEQPVEIIGYPVEGGFIAAGMAVSKGTIKAGVADRYNNYTSPFNVKPFAAGGTAADVLGIAVSDAANRRNVANGDVGKPIHSMQGVMTKGWMIKRLWEDVTAGAEAFVVNNATNTVNAPVGAIVGTDLGGAAVALPGVTWFASYTVATTKYGIVKVDL